MTRSFIEYLIEARSHADQNPKISVNQHINAALQKVVKAKDRVGGIYNCFVSMTSVDKLGINPQSEYETPLGIYSYPAIYVHKAAKNDRELTSVLPFAGELEHANIFSVQGNIINLGEIKDTEVVELYKKIAHAYHAFKKGKWKADIDNVEYYINTAPEKAKVSSLPGGRLWYVMMSVAALMAESGGKAPILWNKLFREIGVDGVIDMGHGIVHTNEPTQAVFFSSAAIRSVDRVANKYSPDAVAGRVQLGKDTVAKKAALAGKSDEELMAMMDELEITLEDVPHPSERVKLFAVSIAGSQIQHIRHPSDEIQMAAVKSNPKAVRYIKNPTEAAQIVAVEHSSTVLKLLKNPSEKVKIASVSAWPHSIGSILNPSEAVQIAAVRGDPKVIRFIDHPTPKVQKLAKKLLAQAQ